MVKQLLSLNYDKFHFKGIETVYGGTNYIHITLNIGFQLGHENSKYTKTGNFSNKRLYVALRGNLLFAEKVKKIKKLKNSIKESDNM